MKKPYIVNFLDSELTALNELKDSAHISMAEALKRSIACFHLIYFKAVVKGLRVVFVTKDDEFRTEIIFDQKIIEEKK